MAVYSKGFSSHLEDQSMAAPLVSYELWAIVEPLIPKHEPSPKGGRPRLDDRKLLAGILFVLKSGIPWEMLPQEMNSSCGMTCWRRLKEWQEAGCTVSPQMALWLSE